MLNSKEPSEKMKIGVWLGSDVISTQGGGASYQNHLVRMIDNYQFSPEVEICFLSFVPQDHLKKEIIVLRQLPGFLYRRANRFTLFMRLLKKIDKAIVKRKGLEKVLQNTGVKVVYYVYQTLCFDQNFPFIATNWDIGYMSTHAFPELTSPEFYDIRDSFYKRTLPKALMIICESNTGKQELISYTNMGAHKIRIMPMFAGGVSSLELSNIQMEQILKDLQLEKFQYFFYPAQFWAHKNHVGLLKAYREFVNNEKSCIKLVLTGSNKGNVDYIKELIHEYKLEKDVVLLGFVTEETVYTLYKNAMCLVMASHFGPTNMPPIEAMELGCPVACSDLGGHREILGNSAVYFDSYNYQSIFHALKEMVEKREYYQCKIREQRGITLFNSDRAMKNLNEILEEVVNIRSNWA